MQNALAAAGIAARRIIPRVVERRQSPADCAVLVAVRMQSSGDCPPQPRSSGPADGLTHPADDAGGFAHLADNHVALDDARDPGRREEIDVAKCHRKGKRSRKQAHSPRHPRIPDMIPKRHRTIGALALDCRPALNCDARGQQVLITTRALRETREPGVGGTFRSSMESFRWPPPRLISLKRYSPTLPAACGGRKIRLTG